VCVTPNILLAQNIPIFLCRQVPAHGLSFSFFRRIRRMQNFISFSFSKEKERNGHLLKKKVTLKKNYKKYSNIRLNKK